MSYVNRNHFSIGGFAIACVLTLAINGLMLLGFNHLAQSSDAVNKGSVSQLAASVAPATQVAL